MGLGDATLQMQGIDVAQCTQSCMDAWELFEDPSDACYEAHVFRSQCVGTLDCAGHAAWFGGDPRAFPCFQDDQRFAEQCLGA